MANKLTGATRYRVQSSWGRRLIVLQVEEDVEDNDTDPQLSSFYTSRYKRWRDACVEDLTTILGKPE